MLFFDNNKYRDLQQQHGNATYISLRLSLHVTDVSVTLLVLPPSGLTCSFQRKSSLAVDSTCWAWMKRAKVKRMRMATVTHLRVIPCCSPTAQSLQHTGTHGHYAVTTRSPRGHYTVTMRSLRGHYAVTTRSLHGHHPVTTRSLHGHYMVTTWSLCGQYAVTMRSVRGHYMVTTWSLHGHYMVTYMVTTWSLRGHYVVTTRSLRGHYVVTTNTTISVVKIFS